VRRLGAINKHVRQQLSSALRLRKRNEILSVQYLRASAALAVLCFHAAKQAGGSWELGEAGVDVFFVISGFIMWTVTCGRPVGGRAFILNRLSRLAPPYVVLTLGLAYSAYILPGLFPNLRLSFSHILLSLLLIPHLNPDGELLPVVIPGWTLTFEAFFYVLFALCLSLKPVLRAWACTGLLAALVAAGFAFSFSNPLWITYTNNLLLEFAAGLWLGVAWSRSRMPHWRWGVVMLLCGVVGLGLSTPLHPVLSRLPRMLYWGLPAMLVVGGALTIEAHLRVPRWRLGLLLGGASYSLYLLHIYVISIVWHLLGAGPLFVPLCVVLSSVAALLFWRTVEMPGTRWLRQILGSASANNSRAASGIVP
jgi:exopolysaccharide production protein ExoZ